MTRKASLAVALIVKNEAANLRDCLLSAQGFADEVVLLDAGSTDATESIAREFTGKFYRNPDWPGFGRQRQLAQEKVSADYVLWVDADERLTPALKASIDAVLAAPEANTVYSIPRLSWVFGRFIRHCGWYPQRVIRLYPTALTRYDAASVHEKVAVDATMRVKNLDGDLLHYPYRDLQHYLMKSGTYAAMWAEQRHASGKRGSIGGGLLHGLGCFLKMYVLNAGFLDGRQGLLLSILSAHSTFVKYAELWIRTTTSPARRGSP
jgi:(heptosyl)LPS beta-1,4-glucosyltransferase